MDKTKQAAAQNLERDKAEAKLVAELRKAEQNFGTGISLQDFRSNHERK